MSKLITKNSILNEFTARIPALSLLIKVTAFVLSAHPLSSGFANFISSSSPIFTRQFSPVPMEESNRSLGLIRPFDWDQKEKAFRKKFYKIEILGINNNSFFQNQYFTFYRSTKDTAIGLNIKEEKVINVFFNLQKMQNYFVDLGAAIKVPLKLDTIKVRIDIPYNFSATSHYDKSDSEYNIARTIPPYDPNKVPAELMRVLPWSTEIWFSPKWEIPMVTKYVPISVIDTAMCPDVVYHEYTHVITGKYLGNNSVGRALNEGLSDYFAATLINHPELYSFKTCRAKPFQFFEGSFKFREPGIYHRNIEEDFTANFKLVPGILWKIRKLLGPALADMVIFNAITMSAADTLIFPDFFENINLSLIKFLGEVVAIPFIQKIEDTILVPHKIFTSFSLEKTYFKYLPKKNTSLVNIDARFYEILHRELPNFCSKRNEFKFNFSQFNLTYRYFPILWYCDDYKIAMGIDYFAADPSTFIPEEGELPKLYGNLRFLKSKPSSEDPGLNSLWKFAKHYILADNSLKSVSIRPSKNNSNQIIIDTESSAVAPSYFKFSTLLN